MVSPLFHTSPKHRFFPSPCSVSAYASSSHFFRTARGSFSHGFAEMIDCMNILTPLRLLDNGPNTEGIESWPSIEFTAPAYGIRPYDGRNPYNPLKAEGIRTDLVIFVSTLCFYDVILAHPPISEPTPSGLPFRAIRAPSPPEEPPEVKARL